MKRGQRSSAEQVVLMLHHLEVQTHKREHRPRLQGGERFQAECRRVPAPRDLLLTDLDFGRLRRIEWAEVRMQA